MFSDNQLQILSILINHPEQEYYLSEIGEILCKKPGIFQRGINSLELQEYITSRKKGNQRLFKINKDHPFFDEIKSIVKKTNGAEPLLYNAIKNISGIHLAHIYGSYAKNKLRADSDIDLLLVATSKAEDELLNKLPEIEKRLQREVNYKRYSKKEFAEKLEKKDPFLKEILSNKYIPLIQHKT